MFRVLFQRIFRVNLEDVRTDSEEMIEHSCVACSAPSFCVIPRGLAIMTQLQQPCLSVFLLYLVVFLRKINEYFWFKFPLSNINLKCFRERLYTIPHKTLH